MTEKITPLARQTAASKKLHLIQITIDGKYCSPKSGRISISGTCSPALAKKLNKLIVEIFNGL